MKYYAFRAMLLISSLAFLFLHSTVVRAELGTKEPQACKTIVVGFVGGMRSPEDVKQGVVQIGNRLKSFNDSALQVKIYSHWHWREAYRFICQNLEQYGSQRLSKEDVEPAPKIILYGHSLGGWAVIKLSRRLEKAGIPVALTVQIDSVGLGDEVVPKNVKVAANFYQRTRWLLRGEKRIRAEDDGKTEIVGSFLIRKVGHEALAREAEISDFIVEKVRSLCSSAVMKSQALFDSD